MSTVKRLQIRRDTQENWVSVNPVLLDGEIGFIIENGLIESLKIGNGASAFSQLPTLTLLEAVSGGYVSRDNLTTILKGYLPNNGGTITGDLSVTGEVTINGTSVRSAILGHDNRITSNTEDITTIIQRVAAAEEGIGTVSESVLTLEESLGSLAYKSTITKDDIDASAVTTSKIKDGAITSDKLSDAIKTQLGWIPSTTDDLPEGSTNLYFTEDRAKAALQNDIDALLTEIGTKENKGSGVSEIAFDSDVYELELTRTKDASGSQTAITVDLSPIKNDIPTKVSQLTNDSGFTSNKGTVTSVGLTVPTGLTVTGSPVTSSGTLKISLTNGYSIPTTAKQNAWSEKQDAISDLETIRSNASTAYGWGDHSKAGYLTSISMAGLTIKNADGTVFVEYNPDGGAEIVTLSASAVGLGNVLNVASYSKTESDNKYATKSGYSTDAVLVSNSSGQINASGISTTKLGYLSDVTSNIQSQINAANTSINQNKSVIELVDARFSDYLPLDGGGTIDGSLEISYSLGTMRFEDGAISVDNSGATSWSVDDNGNGSFKSLTADGNSVIHTGNINNYAVTSTTLNDFPRLNGTSPSGASATGTWGIDISGSAAELDSNALMSQIYDWNSGFSSSIFRSSENKVTNSPNGNLTYGIHLRFHRDTSNYYTDLVTDLYNDLLFYRRHTENGFGSWKTIAFTDSTVAASKKLVTSQGTDAITVDDNAHASLSGDLIVNGTSIFAKNYLFMNNGGEGIYLSTAGISWHDSTNTWTKTLFAFKSNGYIGVDRDPDYKLDVNTHARVASIVMEYNDEINRYDGTLYLQYRGTVEGSQGDSRTGNLIMCATGGKVGIGTAAPEYELDVKGSARVGGDLFVNGAQFSVGSDGNLSISKTINGYLPLAGGTMTGPIKYDGYASLGVHSNGNFYLGNPTRPLVIRSNGTHTINDNTLIHTGNIGSQSVSYATNAESATKLATSRTIWGNGFDGTDNITGSIYLPNDSDLITNSGGTGITIDESSIFWHNTSNYKDTNVPTLLKFTSSGYVGVGTDEPEYKLDVKGVIRTSNRLLVGENADTGIWRGSIYSGSLAANDIAIHGDKIILNDGNVGIGTTNPNTKLHVAGDAKIDGALSTSGGGLTIETTNSDIAITHYKGTTKLWTLRNYNGCANFSDALYVQSGSTPVRVATESDLSSYLPKSGGTIDGKLFAIAGGSGASSISYANAALTIGTVNRATAIGSYFPGLAFNHMYTYNSGSTYRNHAHGWIGLRLHSTPTAELSYLIFATNGSSATGSNLTERMCIAPSGEVGIGTTAPEYKLDVNGDAKVSNLIVGGYTLGGNSSGFTINKSGTTYDLLSTSNGYTKTNADNTFIKKTGGTGLGTLEFGTTPNAHIAGCSSTSQLIFRTSINATSSLLFEQEGSNGYVIRSDDEAAYWSLGDSLNRFNTVYCRSVSESSDATKKNVIGNIELTSSQIANAPAVHFTWKDDGTKSVGTIAQYWKDILPEVVSGDEGSMGMNYAVLGVVSSIILARNIETHEQKIQRLEKEISDLRKELEKVAKNQ